MKIRISIINFIAKHIFFKILAIVYKPKYARITMEDLAGLSKESLGYHTYQLLNERNLTIFNGYEVHDFKHALYGIDMSVKGEILMQYFELGNGNKSFSVLCVVVFGTLVFPEFIPSYIKYFKKGKDAIVLKHISIENYINQPIQNLKQQFKIT